MAQTTIARRPSAETPAAKTPFHLRGNFAPVNAELDAFDLEVEGAVPSALDGVYLRNGPNTAAVHAATEPSRCSGAGSARRTSEEPKRHSGCEEGCKRVVVMFTLECVVAPGGRW